MTMRLKQYVLSPAAGKRVIAKALVQHPAIRKVVERGRLVIIAGTTNAYVAEEILNSLGQASDFSRKRFFRGITMPPWAGRTDAGQMPDGREFPGDVVILNGKWQRGKTIFDVVDDLQEGDVILKGANAAEIGTHKAAILIGDPKAGTIGAALQAVAGRRVRLIIPVGVEKRVIGDLNDIAQQINLPGAAGPRLFTVTGEVYSELEAIKDLSGAEVELIAGGGVCGAEGCCRFALTGTEEQLIQADTLLLPLAQEVPFSFDQG
ncbi:hypothetical protein CSA57_05535 [candidate division KSB3 bacterium]|nr:MAG: hypothetical protein CSA57_05535 [candidate division KSB3 bacterium]